MKIHRKGCEIIKLKSLLNPCFLAGVLIQTTIKVNLNLLVYHRSQQSL